jgi:hypothetical protein
MILLHDRHLGLECVIQILFDDQNVLFNTKTSDQMLCYVEFRRNAIIQKSS